MGNSVNVLFSISEQELIRQAIESAESNTSGEIVPMVVEESDHYREAEVAGALVIASFLAFFATLLSGHDTIWFYLPLYSLFLYPCGLIVRKLPTLKTIFISRKHIQHKVRERAVRAFYEKGLYRTKGETGILIFISLLEKKVWILGDRGIHSKLPHESWLELARELSSGIKTGCTVEALCSVIEKCGRMLSLHFPQDVNDTNELPNEILT